MTSGLTRSPTTWQQRLVATSLLCLAVAGASTAGGQASRGRVLEVGGTQPVVGAVLLLLGPRGDTLARALSGPSGEFQLRDPARSARRLRVIRLGYQPRDLELAGAGIPAEIALERLPTLLTAVRIRGASSCPARADRQRALGLWEQSRATFLAAIVARTERPGAKVLLRFEQRLTLDAQPVAQAVSAVVDDATTDPFTAARPLGDFRRYGFVDWGLQSRRYYGPDAALLLDPEFARTYCLALAESPAKDVVGVSFTPAVRGRIPVDVEGEIWVDTVRRTVSEVTFRYLGLSGAAERGGAGGSITYATFANGVTLAHKWEIRIVETSPIQMNRLHDPASPAVPTGLSRVGGELARVRWEDGTEWQAPLGAFAGRVVDCARAPTAGLTVRLADTDYLAITDSSGAFTVGDLVPGPYSAVIEEPADREGRTLERLRVHFDAVRDSTLQVLLVISRGRAPCVDRAP